MFHLKIVSMPILSAELSHAVVKGSNDSIVIVSPSSIDSSLVLANDKLSSLTGFSTTELSTFTLATLIDSHDGLPQLVASLSNSLPESSRILVRIKTSDGKGLPVELNISHFKNNGIIFIRNLETREQLQAIANKHLQSVLRQKQEFIDVMSAFIGDTLVNFYTILMGKTEILGMTHPEQASSLKSVLNQLMNGTNAFRRMTSLDDTPHSFKLGNILDDVYQHRPLKSYWNEHFSVPSKSHFKMDEIPAVIPVLIGRKSLAREALSEVLINAFEEHIFNPDVRINMRYHLDDQYFRIIVEDNGRELSEEQLAKHDFPFFKVLGHKRSTRFGLGSFIASQIMKNSSGKYKFERVGETNRVTLSFKMSTVTLSTL
jgi:anti-sigma regulatory factor (Ser/Thr protein kinase)